MNLKTKKIISVISVVALLCLCFSGCSMMGTGAPATTNGTTSGTGSTLSFVLSMVVLLAVFYFFMIRPEKKRKKQVEEMRAALAPGEKIVTIGGIMGNIVSIGEDNITFETGEDRVRIQVAKWAISNKSK